MCQKIVLSLSILVLCNVFDVNTALTTFGKTTSTGPPPQLETTEQSLPNKSAEVVNHDRDQLKASVTGTTLDELKQLIVEENRALKLELDALKTILQNQQQTATNTDLNTAATQRCEHLQVTYRNCEFAMLNETNKDGLYLLGHAPLAAYCQRFEQKGYMIILRRHYTQETLIDSTHYHNWEAYRNGYGNLNGDHWLGLELLHQLTKDWVYELWLQLKFVDGKTLNVRNGYFKVGAESEGYQLEKGLHLGSGNTEDDEYGDILAASYGQKFTTYDQDNDNNATDNCAVSKGFGWWYNHCSESGIMGRNLHLVKTDANGEKTAADKEISFIQMAIRVADI